MEMVGHQAIGQDPHGLPKGCFGDHVEERLKVLVLVENLGAGIAPVEHVIAVTSCRRSRRARHDESPRSRENHFRTVPPILPRSLGELLVSPFGSPKLIKDLRFDSDTVGSGAGNKAEMAAAEILTDELEKAITSTLPIGSAGVLKLS